VLWSLPAGAASSEVQRLANEAARGADSTKIIIVGVTHDNERLADDLLELLTLLRVNDRFDCLFVENATDLQYEYDQAVNEVDIDRLVKAFYLSRRQRFLMAWRKFGYRSEADQAYIARAMDGGIKEIPKTLPVNREFLAYLKQNKISLLPYDAESASKLLGETVVFEIRLFYANDVIPASDSDMRAAMVKNFDARNSVMAENIVAKFASHQCNKAVLEVGFYHIANRAQLQVYFSIHLDTYTPLQTRLQEKGLLTVVAGKLLGE
jgi:hypothetical protein